MTTETNTNFEENQQQNPRKRVNLNYMLRGKDGKSNRFGENYEKMVNNDDLKSPGVLSDNNGDEMKDIVIDGAQFLDHLNSNQVYSQGHHQPIAIRHLSRRLSTEQDEDFVMQPRKQPDDVLESTKYIEEGAAVISGDVDSGDKIGIPMPDGFD